MTVCIGMAAAKETILPVGMAVLSAQSLTVIDFLFV
jgi:hypothetical protein